MSSDTPKFDWKKEWGPAILIVARYLAVWVVGAALGGLATWLGLPAPPPIVVEKVVHVVEPAAAQSPEGFTTGWVPDPQVLETNRDPAQTLQFDQTPAGKAALGDDDIFNYRAIPKVNNKGPPWKPGNQGSVGSCVGHGFAHGCDVVQATAIASGQRFDWKPVSPEIIYAGSRVEVGGGQIRGDGSVGRWAADWLKLKGGMVPKERFLGLDLTEYDPARCRSLGRSGVPSDLEVEARKYPVKGVALVKSASDVKRALQQGYPVPVCSNIGFMMQRDRDGFCRASGTWNHCMCFIAYRGGNRPGYLCLNSWGPNAHTGPVWPDDMPREAFWVDEQIVDRMVRQGDSFALSDVQGFPARKVQPDWFLQGPPRARPDRFALRHNEVGSWSANFSLSP